MSVVIVGGHDRMTAQYREICKSFQCRPKVFTQIPARFKDQIGSPDLLILFTGTISHKMAISAVQQAEKYGVPVARCRSGSVSALKNILKERC